MTAGMTAMGTAIGMAPIETAVQGPMGVAPKGGQTPPAAVPPGGKPGATYQKADVGAGKRGHYGPGLVTTPVSIFFRVQDNIAFRIRIPEAMNLYKAEHGNAPRTHEEFMEKIIKEGMIKLPDLNEGERYLYDPKSEELLVEHPQR
jgi:hypothetical protein